MSAGCTRRPQRGVRRRRQRQPDFPALQGPHPGGSPPARCSTAPGIVDRLLVTGYDTTASSFIFASEVGMITGWNPRRWSRRRTPRRRRTARPPTIRPSPPPTGPNSKGLDLGQGLGAANSSTPLTSTNARSASTAQHVPEGDAWANGFGSFTDPNLPAGYAPFNVAAIGGKLYVLTRCRTPPEDDAAGAGRGFVSVFDTGATSTADDHRRGAELAVGAGEAPANFGDFTSALLVGNFGNGRINAYDITTGALCTRAPARPAAGDRRPVGAGLGNGPTSGCQQLYYAAGPDDETHGLFRKDHRQPGGDQPGTAPGYRQRPCLHR